MKTKRLPTPQQAIDNMDYADLIYLVEYVNASRHVGMEYWHQLIARGTTKYGNNWWYKATREAVAQDLSLDEMRHRAVTGYSHQLRLAEGQRLAEIIDG